MTTALGILSFFVILAVLILVHELGHFSFAKLMRVRVDEFGIGLPPRIASVRRGETLYSLNAIPLGGFVRMRGENGEEVEPDSFGAKPPWQRLLVLLAGPAMNLLLALGIFFVAFTMGSPQNVTVITQTEPGSPAARAGLQVGDRIVRVDGRPTAYVDDVISVTQAHLGRPLVLTVRRGEREFNARVVARKHPPAHQGPMGIVLDRTENVSYGPGAAAHRSVHEVGAMIASIPTLIGSVSQHGTSQVAGPIGIAQITTKTVQGTPQTGPSGIILLVALLSANLGVLNLLPIPALDGGRIVFVLISWIRRRNLDPQVEGLIHMMGMAALLVLILFVSYQDVVRWITGGSF